MTDHPSPATSDELPPGDEPHERIFLVVVDETEEMRNAL